MKKIILTLTVVATVLACNDKEVATTGVPSNVEGSNDFSYAMGVSLGQQIKLERERNRVEDSIDIDQIKKGIKDYTDNPEESGQYLTGLTYGAQLQRIKNENKAIKDVLDNDEILKGLDDFLNKEELRISEDTLSAYMTDFFNGRLKDMGTTNLEKEKAFFAEKANEKDLTKTENGVYIKTLNEGSGESPSIGDQVEVYYTGKTIDGEVFDSTDKIGSTAKFQLVEGQLIAGWVEAITKMKKGGKYTIYVPSAMAYGETGNRGISPNETLIFDIELVNFSELPEQPANPGVKPEINIKPK